MPIFEYRCRNCGDEFELLIRNSQMEAACPICQSTDITKKLSRFGFSFGGALASSVASSSSCGNCSSNKCSGCHH